MSAQCTARCEATSGWTSQTRATLAGTIAACDGTRAAFLDGMRILIGLLFGLLFTVSAEAGIVRHVNRTDAACGGQSPCYGSIQAAVNATQSGDAVRIQTGHYVEQVSVAAKNAGATNPATRIVIQADPSAPVGSVGLHGAGTQCAAGHGLPGRPVRLIPLPGVGVTG